MHTILLETSGLSASAKTKIKLYLQVWWGLGRAKLVPSGEGLMKCVGHTFEILWELVLGKRCLSISEKWSTPGPPYHSIIYHRLVCLPIHWILTLELSFFSSKVGHFITDEKWPTSAFYTIPLTLCTISPLLYMQKEQRVLIPYSRKPSVHAKRSLHVW